MSYDPHSHLVGGFSPNDGTIDFYLRVNALISPSDTVLDLGAGRAAWFEDDKCETRKNIRFIKSKAAYLIAADIDEIVSENKASDEQMISKKIQLILLLQTPKHLFIRCIIP